MSNKLWADKFIKREMLPAGKLAERFNIANPRTHPESQRAATESSLDTVGWIDEISLSTNGNGPPSLDDNPNAVMFDGHERVEIALVRGGPDILVPCRWYQLTTEETDFALLVKDQTSAMAEIVPEKMAALMERAKAMTTAPGLQGMMERLKEQVVDGMLAQGNGAGKDTEPQIDKAAELQEKWQVQPGQLWQLGELHRVICGDCTDRAVVDLLTDEKITLSFADPPYGVKMAKGFEGFEGFGGFGGFGPPIARRQYTDDWDEDRPDQETFKIILSAANNAMIFGGNYFADILPRSTHWLVWDKLNTMPTYGDCELIWTNFDKKSVKKVTFQYNGLIGKEKDRFHPTQKPVGLYVQILEEYSDPKAIIFDPFLGSGTTLIACQNLNRRCRGVEIEPKYVSVTLQRFLDHTGIQPRLLETVGA